MNIRYNLISLALFAVVASSAQKPFSCATAEMTEKSYKEHPEFLAAHEQLEQFTADYVRNNVAERTASNSAPTYLIPIVFHIIHNYGPENISDAQVYDEVKILCRDYRMRNADTASVIPSFKGIKADTKIEFRLAQKDPSGNCTNGIDRVASLLTYKAGDNSKLNDWPSNRYLNVWVVSDIANGAAGYAYFPGTINSAADGVVILSNYIGSVGTSNPNQSRALTHEIGHTLNLYHPWGNSNSPGVSCSGSDQVADTPDTKGWNFCPAATAAAICNPPVIENYSNYMDYSYCSNMFTAGQAARMTAAIVSSAGSRNQLWSAANLIATGINVDTTINTLCKADFVASNQNICAGSSITFSNNSWNGTPSTYSWTFTGGNPSSANTGSVNVTYPAAGIYDVSLTVGNGVTLPSVTKTGYVSVFGPTAQHPGTWSDGFEGETVPSADWYVNNPDNGVTWVTTKTAGYQSATSVYIDNMNNDTSRVDELISGGIDLTAISGTPKLYFQRAYAQKNSGSADVLKIYVSTNCGLSWGGSRLTLLGSKLATVPAPQTTKFIPASASQWRLDSLTLLPYTSFNDVRLKFQFTNGNIVGGNEIYLDNINIGSTNSTVGIRSVEAGKINFSIYPNPIEDKATLSFNLVNGAKVSAVMYDILGKVQFQIVDGRTLSAGNYTYPFGTEGMNSGIYFVKLLVDEQLYVKKIVVR